VVYTEAQAALSIVAANSLQEFSAAQEKRNQLLSIIFNLYYHILSVSGKSSSNFFQLYCEFCLENSYKTFVEVSLFMTYF
jgi:hypothetical protein